MTASELIQELQHAIAQHGDLEIVGGYLADDTPLREVTVVNADGCEVGDGRGGATGIFLQA